MSRGVRSVNWVVAIAVSAILVLGAFVFVFTLIQGGVNRDVQQEHYTSGWQHTSVETVDEAELPHAWCYRYVGLIDCVAK